MIDELFLPFKVGFGLPSIAGMYNFVVAIGCLTMLATMVFRAPQILARPAFITALFTHVLLQWPLTFFIGTLQRSLENWWLLAISIHLTVAGCLAMVYMTPRLTSGLVEETRLGSAPTSRDSSRDELGRLSHPGKLLLAAIFSVGALAYLWRIDPRCTGLYAMVMDPEATLLAREVSSKLFAQPIDSYVLGALINVVCPLLVFACILETQRAAVRKRWLSMVAWIGLGCFPVMFVLVTGTKGNLLPTALGVSAGLLTSRASSLLQKGLTLILVGTAAIAFLISVELAIDRGSKAATGCYPLGYCAARAGACNTTKHLIESLWSRDYSLALTRARLVLLADDLSAGCAPQASKLPMCHTLASPRLPKDENFAETIGKPASPRIDELRVQEVKPQPAAGALSQTGVRLLDYFISIGYRAGVVPLQIGSWHYKYVSEFGAPGFKALAGAGAIYGERVIMPVLVHQNYYPIFAGGDKTSTGTAPTSFILGYPAYLGVLGIALALACIGCYDFVGSRVLGLLPPAVRWVGVSLTAISCYNFMTSDFSTAMASHGGAVALALLFLVGTIDRRGLSLNR